MSIRRRLTVALSTVVLASIFSVVLGTSASGERARTVDVLTDTLDTERDIAHLEQCLQDLHRQVTLLAQSFDGLGGSGLAPEVRAGLDAQLDTCAGHARDLDGGARGGNLLGAESAILLEDWRFVAANLGVRHVEALARQATQADPRSRRVLYELLPDARFTQAARVSEAQADFARVSSRTDATLVSALAVSVLVVSGVAITLLRRLVTALGTLTDGVERVGRGEFTHRVVVGGSDEFADVAREVNAMAARLGDATVELEARAVALERTVDQLRTAQATLVEQEKMAALGTLVAGVAHEVNTPLGVAVTAGSLVHEQFTELRTHAEAGTATRGLVRRVASESEEALRLMLDNLRRASQLVQSFKQVAVDRGHVATRTTALGTWARAVVQSLSPLARRHGVNVTVQVNNDSRARLAAGELEQVLTNLVVNAIVHGYRTDATPEPPLSRVATQHPESAPTATRDVRVVVMCAPDAVTLEVSDDGAGMAPEVAARVFEPFFTTRRGAGGSGLGMHIVHQVITGRFDGTVTLDTKPGAGTRWTVRLPTETAALRYVAAGEEHDVDPD